jgi:hypothetical protein
MICQFLGIKGCNWRDCGSEWRPVAVEGKSRGMSISLVCQKTVGVISFSFLVHFPRTTVDKSGSFPSTQLLSESEFTKQQYSRCNGHQCYPSSIYSRDSFRQKKIPGLWIIQTTLKIRVGLPAFKYRSTGPTASAFAAFHRHTRLDPNRVEISLFWVWRSESSFSQSGRSEGKADFPTTLPIWLQLSSSFSFQLQNSVIFKIGVWW